jgi:uncharacterized protein (TIGR03066 family)
LPRDAGPRTVNLRVVPGHNIATGELDLKTMTLGLASLLVLGLTMAYGEDKKDDNKTKIVGVWEVVKSEASNGPQKGATVECTKDGKFKLTFEENGSKTTIEGTYKVDGDSVKSESKAPDGKEHKETLKIKELTDKKLVLEDEEGKQVEFKRVEKPKDKDK